MGGGSKIFGNGGPTCGWQLLKEKLFLWHLLHVMSFSCLSMQKIWNFGWFSQKNQLLMLKKIKAAFQNTKKCSKLVSECYHWRKILKSIIKCCWEHDKYLRTSGTMVRFSFYSHLFSSIFAKIQFFHFFKCLLK